jgi:DNA polymerase III subunit chi
MFLRTSSPAESKAIDDLLWTFSDRAFLPHEVVDTASSPHPKVAALIGHEAAPAGYRGLLINIASDIPADADAFERIAEVVAADPDRKQQARARFKLYRDRGWTLETHNVA